VRPATTQQDASVGETYRVVFWGETARGFSRTEVAVAFAKKFNIKSRSQLRQLFSGKVITLKHSLSTAEAHRYIDAIQDVGGICRLESENKHFFFEAEVKEKNVVSFLQEKEYDFESVTIAPKM